MITNTHIPTVHRKWLKLVLEYKNSLQFLFTISLKTLLFIASYSYSERYSSYTIKLNDRCNNVHLYFAHFEEDAVISQISTGWRHLA